MNKDQFWEIIDTINQSEPFESDENYKECVLNTLFPCSFEDLLDWHHTLHAFLRAVVVPEMQIKLKQGFGRAIRTETDTCVVAILDERAAKDQRYWKDVLTTLPEMPITQDLHQVEAFIRGVKPDSYFQERTA